MEKSRKPKIRFKGYNDDWEQRKLGQLASSFEYGLNAASKSYDGINKYIRITDIDDETRTFLDTDLTSLDCDLSLSENYLLKDGDILFARTGASVGKTFIYKAFNGVVYYAGFLIRARLKENCSPQFVFYNTLTKEYEKFIRVTSQRSGQPGVNAHEYATFELRLPKYDEQCEIGKFFTNLDHLITLHQRKLEKLMNVKKSMLEKMFPKQGSVVPEIRFCGFTDAWEQRKLGEMASLITKGTTPVDKRNAGIVNFVKIESIDESSGDITINQKISVDEHNGYLRRSQLKENDILFSIAGTLGRVTSVKSSILPANTNQALAIIRLKDGYLDYVKTYLKGKAVVDFIKKNPTIGAQPNLSLNQVSNLIIMIPSDVEQKEIGVFFEKIDNLITLHQRKLEKLKNIKKSMLEKMFI